MNTKLTVGQAMRCLRQQHGMRISDLEAPLNIKAHRYSQIERDLRELSFLAAVKLCKFYGLALDEFISLIGQAEFERKDLDTLKFERKREGAALRKTALETAARMIQNGIVHGKEENI
jgi:transcriptional regulator with XRE-family HTH domain